MPRSILRIILQRRGCANRPFYHISAQNRFKRVEEEPIEQIGSFDPMPNSNEELLLSINFERLKFYLSSGAIVTKPAAELLGLCGYFPIHPRSYMKAWNYRQKKIDDFIKENSEPDTNEVEN